MLLLKDNEIKTLTTLEFHIFNKKIIWIFVSKRTSPSHSHLCLLIMKVADLFWVLKCSIWHKNVLDEMFLCCFSPQTFILTWLKSLLLLFPQAGLQVPLFTTQTAAPAVSPWRKPSAGQSKTPSATTCWSTSTMEPESLCRCLPMSRVTGCPPGKPLQIYTLMVSVYHFL